MDAQGLGLGQGGAYGGLQACQALQDRQPAAAATRPGLALRAVMRTSILPRRHCADSRSRTGVPGCATPRGFASKVEKPARSRTHLDTDAPRGADENLPRRSGGRHDIGVSRHAVDWHSALPEPSKARLCPSEAGPTARRYGGGWLPDHQTIGSRRFGVVYLAEDPDHHLVALKEYLPSLAERSPGELTPRVKPDEATLYRLGLKSFFEKAARSPRSSHPSVVSVLNFLRENETVYMVMNYLQGDTLQDFIVTARDLKRDKVFRESTIRSLFDEILRGCASCTSTRCCTWTSSRPTSSSPMTTRPCCSTLARRARC